MRIGRFAARVAAVAVLVFGIVVMHHIAQSGHDGSAAPEAPTLASGVGEAAGHAMSASGPQLSDDAAAGTAAGDGAMSAGHVMLHLCLAVLTAAAVVLVGWLLLTLRPWAVASPLVLFRVRPLPARPPPRPHGSALLMSLCVMRT
ncbi:hypothetical protein C1I92_02495 [Jiangella anatolica]|uniref:Uncharacterized protein n=1 Tax=Jiangella anatolica TaxID=2670374 RepID=A0A2W2BL71_9ACTN|nr:hypothetical protein C1I92_02495 [Jiangella anatolica]